MSLVITQPPPGKTLVVLDPEALPAYSVNQETDARTAVARGLREYVEQLRWSAWGGRLLLFKKVFETWPQAESAAEYPSASVLIPGSGAYAAARLTPEVRGPVEGMALLETGEFNADVVLGVWATDNKERSGLVAMLEAAFSPVDWMYGVRLELPHYFGTRATYEPVEMTYEDSAEDAMRRYFKATITLRAAMPMIRAAKLPLMRPSAQIDAAGDDFSTPGNGVTRVFD